jgi:LysR family transcriptional regulator, glycine cleavage system transcriptional activator
VTSAGLAGCPNDQILQAAIEDLLLRKQVCGLDIALVRSALAYRDLAEGRLVRPMPESRPAAFAYWIVCPSTAANMPKIVRFREWLLRQAKGESR